jgi:PAP2 superfamily
MQTPVSKITTNKVRNTKTNSWSSSTKSTPTFTAKTFGEGKYLLPLSLLSASVNLIDQDTAIGNWGAAASRAYIIGLPILWFSQLATGGSRPDETANNSSWHPLKDNNGVSGHSFVGAVPFLTIAYLNPENNYIKYAAYAASTAAAISRVNDNDHYPSQIFLGWYLAWEAVDAVFENNRQSKGMKISPMVMNDGFGLVAKGFW